MTSRRSRVPGTPEPQSREGRWLEQWLERSDQVVYGVVALLFLVAAVAMAGYAVEYFIRHARDGFPVQLVTFINDLLLVLIILEVLGTVRSYLLTGTTSLTPFLYIGIISATRRILAIGAATTLGEASTNATFHRQMIDLGANAGVVLALALALFLFGRLASERATKSDDEGQHWQ